MALLELMNKLTACINAGEILVGLIIDSAKVFDIIDHRIFLSKLQHYGIRGTAFQWFESYLSDRRQCVSIDDYESGFAVIKCSVPQGSILGPVLFLHINDLGYASKILQSVMFADDTNMFLTGKSIDVIEVQFNSELVVNNEWPPDYL